MSRARGQSFEFVGGAIVPIGTGGAVATEMLGAGKDIAPGFVSSHAEVTAEQVVAQIKGASVRLEYSPTAPVFIPPTKPINVLREAKRRLRDVRRELKALKALEREASELERIIKAATTKPLPAVRPLTRNAG